MRRWTREDSGERTIQAVGLRIGAEEYGIPISAIREVHVPPPITRVPNAPQHIMGVINLRGSVIAVIDLASRLGIGHTVLGESARLVAVDDGEEQVALAAERVSPVIRINADSIKPPPPAVAGISAEFIDAVARLPERFLIFPNLERLLHFGLGSGGAKEC